MICQWQWNEYFNLLFLKWLLTVQWHCIIFNVVCNTVYGFFPLTLETRFQKNRNSFWCLYNMLYLLKTLFYIVHINNIGVITKQANITDDFRGKRKTHVHNLYQTTPLMYHEQIKNSKVKHLEVEYIWHLCYFIHSSLFGQWWEK